jgi:integrase
MVCNLMKKANPVWQVILGLSRYGGLRTPSETLSLRWEDIDRELNRMNIPEPKVEHHEGRGIRSCPIFPELRPILDEAFEIVGDVWRQKRIRGLTCTPRSQERYQHAGKRYRADFGFFYPRFFRA